MRMKSTVPKESFSIRIPAALNQKLLERTQEIGISKAAFILSILYRELETTAKKSNADTSANKD